MTTEPNNVKKLQQRNYNLVVENEFLKDENNRLNEICIYWEQQYNELKQENTQLKDSKYNYIELYKQQLGKNNFLEEENEQLKQQITQLKNIKRNDHKTIERLIKIITDEHYN